MESFYAPKNDTVNAQLCYAIMNSNAHSLGMPKHAPILRDFVG